MTTGGESPQSIKRIKLKQVQILPLSRIKGEK